jgi:hypothetical protein
MLILQYLVFSFSPSANQVSSATRPGFLAPDNGWKGPRNP